MRILHVIRGLANSSGTTHIVGPLAEAQARLGHDVRVIFVEKYGEPPVMPDPALVRSECFPMTVRSRHFGWSRSYADAISRAVRDVDVVHIHAIWNFVTWWAMRAAHRANVPYLVAPQGSLEDWALGRSRYPKQLYAKVTEKRYFDRAAAMQVLTETEADQCARFGIRGPAKILPNGVDLSVIDRTRDAADLREEFGFAKESVLFIFLGRLFPKKGLDLLIPAFAKLADERADVGLVVAGHDAGSGYRGELEAMVMNSPAHDRIRFIGEVSGDRKFAVLRGADVFALTSYSEGLPVAVLEAMACGLPVVITPGCNIPEVSAHCAGWQVEANIGSVLEGLRAAANDAAARRRRGMNGRQLVEEKFTWPSIAEQSISIYEEFFSQSRAARRSGPILTER
ncbi:MAG: glycosyltransferase [Candidatus Paceibacterota bacterium]